MRDYLVHYGIKGMHWGIRKDRDRGLLGKKRRSYSEDYTSSRKKKDPRSMTNEELQKRITRYNLEKQYRNLEPTTLNRGWELATKILKISGTIGGLYALSKAPWTNAAMKAIGQMPIPDKLNKHFMPKIDPDLYRIRSIK